MGSARMTSRWRHECPLCHKVIIKPDEFHIMKALEAHGRKAHPGKNYEYEVRREELVDEAKANAHNG